MITVEGEHVGASAFAALGLAGGGGEVGEVYDLRVEMAVAFHRGLG